MKNVLIIENKEEDFLDIKKVLDSTGEFHCWPKDIISNEQFILKLIATDPSEKDNHDAINSKIKEVSDSNNIDLLILDVNLVGDSDNIGLDYNKYFFCRGDLFVNLKTIVLSAYYSQSTFPSDVSNKNTRILSKTDMVEADLDLVLRRKMLPIIEELLGMQLVNPSVLEERKIDKRPSKISETFSFKNPVTSFWNFFAAVCYVVLYIPRFVFGFNFKKDEISKRAIFYDNYKLRWRSLIDFLIHIIFYLVLGSSVVISGVTLIINLWKGLKNVYSPSGETVHLDEVTSISPAKEILQNTEYAFIAFLLWFVVFGFFLFYKKYLSPELTEQQIQPVDLEKASEMMTLTKKLFVSTLISFLVIKLIEEFGKFPAINIDNRLFIYKASAYMALLIILIIYFIYVNKKRN